MSSCSIKTDRWRKSGITAASTVRSMLAALAPYSREFLTTLVGSITVPFSTNTAPFVMSKPIFSLVMAYSSIDGAWESAP